MIVTSRVLSNFLGLIILLLFAGPKIAIAEVRSMQMKVTANITPMCKIKVNDIDFGVYTSAQAATAMSFTILCTKGTRYEIKVRSSNKGTATARKMNFRSQALNYALYQNKEMNTLWGNDNTNSLSGVGTGEEQVINIYGLMPANQKLPTGYYVDTLLLLMSYGATTNFTYQTSVTVSAAAEVK